MLAHYCLIVNDNIVACILTISEVRPNPYHSLLEYLSAYPAVGVLYRGECAPKRHFPKRRLSVLSPSVSFHRYNASLQPRDTFHRAIREVRTPVAEPDDLSVLVTLTIMHTEADRARLARDVLDFAFNLKSEI